MKIIQSSAYIEAKKKSKKKNWDPNPWAICHSTVDKDKNPDKFENCVQDVKSKQSSKTIKKGKPNAILDVSSKK